MLRAAIYQSVQTRPCRSAPPSIRGSRRARVAARRHPSELAGAAVPLRAAIHQRVLTRLCRCAPASIRGCWSTRVAARRQPSKRAIEAARPCRCVLPFIEGCKCACAAARCPPSEGTSAPVTLRAVHQSVLTCLCRPLPFSFPLLPPNPPSTSPRILTVTSSSSSIASAGEPPASLPSIHSPLLL
eukprot:253092-Chlamydomonas_euryale.AAC.2